MADEFLSFLRSIDFEEYGELSLTNAEWLAESLIITLKVIADKEPNLPTDWQIVCSEVRKQFLSLGSCLNFDFSHDHVLLWEFSKLYSSVSFNGKTENPFAVIGSLYQKHTELTENWIPFHRFFNEHIDLVKLISGGYGVLAEAPEPLAIAYEEVLKQSGFSVSRSQSRKSHYWDGEKWMSQTNPLSVMIFEDSYIIAEKIEAIKFVK